MIQTLVNRSRPSKDISRLWNRDDARRTGCREQTILNFYLTENTITQPSVKTDGDAFKDNNKTA